MHLSSDSAWPRKTSVHGGRFLCCRVAQASYRASARCQACLVFTKRRQPDSAFTRRDRDFIRESRTAQLSLIVIVAVGGNAGS
ncbi:hypothetical protein EXIGLDRAFT_506070 [Exidia glandulosa HHB12029]|uniref:Uncharacterized protein n=1 Tax=Exidia glandulosa HHB12029 TaxID=1314781 RepID=A0A165JBG9_EXIGL|nr:hypothetical protein EXIGLDRAFT_506070 [Exidia glandulosa HHB12029]